MDKKKIYIGKGKTVKTKYGTLLNVAICLTDIPKEEIFKSDKTGKSYIRLTVAKMQKDDEYKNSHTIFINDFKPGDKKKEDDDLPF